MRRVALVIAIEFLCVFFVSCLTNVDEWLNSQPNEPPLVDMNGKWDSDFSGGGAWGTGDFVQQGNQFRGTLGGYRVRGVVTGKTVRMVISNEDPNNTGKLELQPGNWLKGKTARNANVETSRATSLSIYPLGLKRMKLD